MNVRKLPISIQLLSEEVEHLKSELSDYIHALERTSLPTPPAISKALNRAVRIERQLKDAVRELQSEEVREVQK